jgi:hypothetical protein
MVLYIFTHYYHEIDHIIYQADACLTLRYVVVKF